MLTFVGLGLYDERSVTVEGREALAGCDRAFAEFYTSRLVGTDPESLAAHHDLDLTLCDRADVERDPEIVLDAAATDDVAFLTAGDTMISTTHVDLRLRAHDRGVDTRVVHGVTARSAAAGLTGLQNYRFGRATTLPFPWAHGGADVPESLVEVVAANDDRGLHTLTYLDIKVDAPAGYEDRQTYLRADRAAELLAGVDDWADRLGVVVARAGSPEPLVVADTLADLADRRFGDPLHLLVLPGELHHLEAEALSELAGAPSSVVED